jgi:DNA-binding NarL/FixJ family response regulator
VRRNGLLGKAQAQNAKVNSPNGAAHTTTTVLVAVESAQVREALVAMLGALDRFRVVAEADTDSAAIEAARRLRPHLALVEPELSGCGGWWAIRQIQVEHLAGVVVGIGRRADCLGLNNGDVGGAHRYIQIGTSPRELLSALEMAMAQQPSNGSAVAETQRDLLADTHPMI